MSIHLDEQESGVMQDRTRAKILLVEDDEVLCELIRRNLQIRGHMVRIANDGASALACLRTEPFDLVLLDINLPDQTGWEVLRIVQQEGLLPLIDVRAQKQVLPVVVLSAVRVSLQRLAEFHLLAYLPKPFPMDALLRFAHEAAIRCRVDQSRQRTQVLPGSLEEDDV
jgi:DNA-binding response OmpR family regulator